MAVVVLWLWSLARGFVSERTTTLPASFLAQYVSAPGLAAENCGSIILLITIPSAAGGVSSNPSLPPFPNN